MVSHLVALQDIDADNSPLLFIFNLAHIWVIVCYGDEHQVCDYRRYGANVW
jgi:hypothetical protein